MIQKYGYIPAHITGPISGQDWAIFEGRTKPFPNALKADATASIVAQSYTPIRMFQDAEKVCKEMGLMGVAEEFWNKSVLVKPTDETQMTCHPQLYMT